MENVGRKKTLIVVVAIAVGMFGLSYAAFPLYTLFCRVTGYGGTTNEAAQAPEQSRIGDRVFTIRFNADVDKGLAWAFKPQQKKIKIKVGENKLAFYTSKNLTDSPITGVATYNVAPEEAGYYFTKIHCFCFDKQTLKGGEEVEMPVSFFVDPEIENDPFLKDLKTITLSYTFFEATE